MKKNLPITLNEEINRIKRLMEFTISENSHDVLSEQTKVSSDVYGKESGSYNRTELPGIVGKYNPTSGFLSIKDGNTWLAEQRAISLSKFLADNVEKQTVFHFLVYHII